MLKDKELFLLQLTNMLVLKYNLCNINMLETIHSEVSNDVIIGHVNNIQLNIRYSAYSMQCHIVSLWRLPTLTTSNWNNLWKQYKTVQYTAQSIVQTWIWRLNKQYTTL